MRSRGCGRLRLAMSLAAAWTAVVSQRCLVGCEASQIGKRYEERILVSGVSDGAAMLQGCNSTLLSWSKLLRDDYVKFLFQRATVDLVNNADEYQLNTTALQYRLESSRGSQHWTYDASIYPSFTALPRSILTDFVKYSCRHPARANDASAAAYCYEYQMGTLSLNKMPGTTGIHLGGTLHAATANKIAHRMCNDAVKKWAAIVNVVESHFVKENLLTLLSQHPHSNNNVLYVTNHPTFSPTLPPTPFTTSGFDIHKTDAFIPATSAPTTSPTSSAVPPNKQSYPSSPSLNNMYSNDPFSMSLQFSMRTQEASTISDVSQMLKPELKRRLERQLLDVTKQEGNARQRLLRAMSQVVTHPLLLGIDIVDIQKLDCKYAMRSGNSSCFSINMVANIDPNGENVLVIKKQLVNAIEMNDPTTSRTGNQSQSYTFMQMLQPPKLEIMQQKTTNSYPNSSIARDTTTSNNAVQKKRITLAATLGILVPFCILCGVLLLYVKRDKDKDQCRYTNSWNAITENNKLADNKKKMNNKTTSPCRSYAQSYSTTSSTNGSYNKNASYQNLTCPKMACNSIFARNDNSNDDDVGNGVETVLDSSGFKLVNNEKSIADQNRKHCSNTTTGKSMVSQNGNDYEAILSLFPEFHNKSPHFLLQRTEQRQERIEQNDLPSIPTDSDKLREEIAKKCCADDLSSISSFSSSSLAQEKFEAAFASDDENEESLEQTNESIEQVEEELEEQIHQEHDTTEEAADLTQQEHKKTVTALNHENGEDCITEEKVTLLLSSANDDEPSVSNNVDLSDDEDSGTFASDDSSATTESEMAITDSPEEKGQGEEKRAHSTLVESGEEVELDGAFLSGYLSECSQATHGARNRVLLGIEKLRKNVKDILVSDISNKKKKEGAEENWVAVGSEEGKMSYVNTLTKEATSERPDGNAERDGTSEAGDFVSFKSGEINKTTNASTSSPCLEVAVDTNPIADCHIEDSSILSLDDNDDQSEDSDASSSDFSADGSTSEACDKPQVIPYEIEVAEDMDDNPWAAVLDKSSGEIYYYNKTTRETTWTKPEALSKSKESEMELVVWKCDNIGGTEGTWKAVKDTQTGKTYYYNTLTRQTQWENPEGMTKVTENLVQGTSTKDAELKKVNMKDEDGSDSESEYSSCSSASFSTISNDDCERER